MNKVFYIIAFLLSITAFSQDLKKVDEVVLNYPEYMDMNALAERINSDFDSDLEKVRAVYTWIIDNIAYSFSGYTASQSYTYRTLEELEAKKRQWRLQAARNTMKTKQGVCHGYSMLFKELCNILGIRSLYVSGAAKTEFRDIGKAYESDHAWNIVEIDGNAYLVDTTWGAGNYNQYGFEKENTYAFFLSHPKDFILNHYPDDYKHSLLDTYVSKTAFSDGPLIYPKTLSDYRLITPTKGSIQRATDVSFSFKVNTYIKWISYGIGNETMQIKNYRLEEGQLHFSLDLTNAVDDELTIFINGEGVVVFKLED